MNTKSFEKQEELTKTFWNKYVYLELTDIYKKLYQKPINLSPDINEKDFSKQVKSKRMEQSVIVNYWNDNFPKFRCIENKFYLFKLEQSTLMPEGFFVSEYSYEDICKNIDLLNKLAVKNIERIQTQINIIGVLIFICVILIIIIMN